MNSIKYNDINIKTLRVDSKIKYNMKDVFNALDYNNYEDYFNDNDDNRYYSLGLLKKRFNDNEKEKELIKYLENNTLMDIFTFINNNNYDFKLGDWFTDIWYPLFDKKDIIITNKILYFIHYGISGGDDHPPLDKYKIIRKDLEKILKNYNIEYNKIKYYRNIDKEYDSLIIEIESITSNNIIQKSWIRLSVRNFKKLILRLRTKVADEIRDYYITLEEILYDYAKHINNYNNILKNKEIIQLKLEKEKAERRSLRLKEKFIEEKKHKLDQIIYISTSKSYAAQNRFKVGGVDNNNLLKPRLSTYNSRSAEGDEWYYTYIKKVNNYKQFESRFWSVMSSFRDKKDKEILILYYNDLIDIFNFIADNYNEDIDYFNKNVKIFIDNIDNDKFYVPEPFNIELVNICSIKNGKVDNKLIIATKEIIIDEIKDYFKIKIESNELEIKRKDINDYIDKKYKFNKRDLWSISKEVKAIFNNIILKY
ncbi:N1R/p28-like protein [Choristoneura rosaceana entomopoxvirus 'L']|uniref:N1R/p28-like protein n=1 Tax=Choristoneura rosaceana entomopoxvirus 'L' TaxID=1293539 RepID=A0ABM9QKQ7_9POXV|nr:N1R/p28-like protein [Choristoneura rosaceana entomopoxvirus 'L']CCU56120.1 N1R/p28-like protein [Choristoneura rosaceana entomopoxvirus 'L']